MCQHCSELRGIPEQYDINDGEIKSAHFLLGSESSKISHATIT